MEAYYDQLHELTKDLLPTMCNSPIYSKAIHLQSVQDSINSGKSTPTSPLKPSRPCNCKRLDLKSRKFYTSDPLNSEYLPFKTQKFSRKVATPSLPINSDDFSNIKSKVTTTQISTFRDTQTFPEQVSANLEEKVRNELMMKNNYHIIRTIKQNRRQDDYKTNGLYLESTLLFSRLSQRMKNPSEKIQPLNKKKHIGTGKIIHDHDQATEKLLEKTSTNWIEKHASVKGEKENDVSKVIFDMIDHEKKGEISGESIAEFLIHVGIILDCKFLYRILCKIKKVRKIGEVKIDADDISSLCRGNHHTNTIFNAMNNILERAVLKKASKFPNFVNCKSFYVQKTLKKWWDCLQNSQFNQVHYTEVCKLLVKKGVFIDFNEAYKRVSINSVDSFLDFNQFLMIFGKVLIKFVLVEIKNKFSVEDWESTNFSPAYKICQLKKQLILAGIKYPVPNISIEEGLFTLNAVEKYLKYVKKSNLSMTFENFEKIWLELTGEKIGMSRFKPDFSNNQFKTQDSDLKLNQKYMNKFTVLGNYKFSWNNDKKWSHSYSPEPETDKNQIGKKLSGLKQKIKKGKDLLSNFQNIINYM